MVKRYHTRTLLSGVDYKQSQMAECWDGDYVLYSDYAQLKERLARYEEANKRKGKILVALYDLFNDCCHDEELRPDYVYWSSLIKKAIDQDKKTTRP